MWNVFLKSIAFYGFNSKKVSFYLELIKKMLKFAAIKHILYNRYD